MMNHLYMKIQHYYFLFFPYVGIAQYIWIQGIIKQCEIR